MVTVFEYTIPFPRGSNKSEVGEGRAGPRFPGHLQPNIPASFTGLFTDNTMHPPSALNSGSVLTGCVWLQAEVEGVFGTAYVQYTIRRCLCFLARPVLTDGACGYRPTAAENRPEVTQSLLHYSNVVTLTV